MNRPAVSPQSHTRPPRDLLHVLHVIHMIHMIQMDAGGGRTGPTVALWGHGRLWW